MWYFFAAVKKNSAITGLENLFHSNNFNVKNKNTPLSDLLADSYSEAIVNNQCSSYTFVEFKYAWTIKIL